MKSRLKIGRVLWIGWGLVLVALVVAALNLRAADSKQTIKQTQLRDSLARSQVMINKGIEDKKSLETGISQSAAAIETINSSITQLKFPTLTQTGDYGQMLVAAANGSGLSAKILNATPFISVKSNNLTCQSATFTINLIAGSPTSIMQTENQYKQYLSDSIDDMFSFMAALAESQGFVSTEIQSVSISLPPLLSAEEIDAMTQRLSGIIRASLSPGETTGRSPQEITQVVEQKLAQKTPEQISNLFDSVGLNKPAATITVVIWAYEGN